MERPVWKDRHGETGMERPAWRDRHGKTGMERPAWKDRHGDLKIVVKIVYGMNKARTGKNPAGLLHLIIGKAVQAFFLFADNSAFLYF